MIALAAFLSGIFAAWVALLYLGPLPRPGPPILIYNPESFPVNEKIFADFTPPTDASLTATVHYTLDGGPEQVVSTFVDSPDNPGMKRAEIDATEAQKGVAWLVFANKWKSSPSPQQAFDVAALTPTPPTPGALMFIFGGDATAAA